MFDGETIILLALLNLSEIGADISNCNVYIAPITLSSYSYWLLKNICIYKYAYKEREREVITWVCLGGPKNLKSSYRFPKWWIFHWENKTITLNKPRIKLYPSINMVESSHGLSQSQHLAPVPSAVHPLAAPARPQPPTALPLTAGRLRYEMTMGEKHGDFIGFIRDACGSSKNLVRFNWI